MKILHFSTCHSTGSKGKIWVWKDWRPNEWTRRRYSKANNTTLPRVDWFLIHGNALRCCSFLFHGGHAGPNASPPGHCRRQRRHPLFRLALSPTSFVFLFQPLFRYTVSTQSGANLNYMGCVTQLHIQCGWCTKCCVFIRVCRFILCMHFFFPWLGDFVEQVVEISLLSVF